VTGDRESHRQRERERDRLADGSSRRPKPVGQKDGRDDDENNRINVNNPRPVKRKTKVRPRLQRATRTVSGVPEEGSSEASATPEADDKFDDSLPSHGST